MKDEIESRSTFSHTYGKWWLLYRFDKWYCCCCRREKRRNDFLFKDAKGKLSEELDVLEIIKKLRVH